MVQYFHDVADHLLSNLPDKSGAFRRNADHYFAAIISCGRAHHVPKVLEPRDKAAGCSRSVAHFSGDLRHAEHFFAIEIGEKEELRERNVARCELLAQAQHETALHFKNDVRKPFGIRTILIGQSSCKRGNRSLVQGDKIRNARTTCQTSR